MGSNFSAIGVRSEAEIEAFLEAALDGGEPEPAGKGTTLRWYHPSGPGLYVHLDKKSNVTCVTPVHRTDRRVSVRFGGYLKDSECAYCSCVQVELLEGGEMLFPFNIQLADAVAVRERLPEAGADLDVAATFFAHGVEVYEDEAAFDAGQGEDGAQFASRSFIPAGMFGGDPALAFFNGAVLEADERTNELTGGAYYHAIVETLGFSADVFLDPEDTELPRPGNILSGEYWTCGVISAGLLDHPARKSFLRRVLS